MLPSKLQEYLPAESKSQAQAVYKSITVAQKYIKGTIARAAIDKAYQETQQVLAVAATAGLAPMLLIMFVMMNIELSDNTTASEDVSQSTVKDREGDKENGEQNR